jgi:AcrR family transcriptional regulator
MAMTEGRGEAWIEAGIKEIARSGVEGVRVEVLAKNLGVTKGGFYRRFKDRAALLDGILQSWSAGRIAAIEQQTSLDGTSARNRLRTLIRLYSERMNTEECRASLSRDGPFSGRGGRAGVSILLLHFRPEPAVPRTQAAQAHAADRNVGRKTARRPILRARPA